MTTPLDKPDFFALEAGESLDRLAALAGREGGPPPDDFLRAARVLRGSALLAGQQPIARAAAGLEALARAHRAQPREWDAATRAQVTQAVDEFRLLVRRVREWGEADTARAARLGQALETLAGRGADLPAPGTQSNGADLHVGVRAFVAREGALVASALDRAARVLRVSPSDREALYTVIRRMQSLRGLAELGELAPLPEILDGIELAIGDLTRMFAPPPGVEEVVEAASHALTRIARDVADRGRPDAESPEARRFTELLIRTFAVERDVVPIESLYVDGDPEPLKPPIAQPRFGAPKVLGPLELVSHGEHLCQTADLLARSRSATERDLRLYHLLGTLRSVGPVGSDPVAAALGVFARSTREALGAGASARATADLVACLRDAGELLRGVVEADDRMLISRRLLDVAHRLDLLREQATAESAPAAERGDAAVAPAGDADVVPIESLLVDGELPIVPIERLAPDEPEPIDTLEASFATYGRLLRERGDGPPSLDALLGRGQVAEEAVAIEELCYRGRGALERAAIVRHELAAALDRDADVRTLRPLLQELLDLVPLALAEP